VEWRNVGGGWCSLEREMGFKSLVLLVDDGMRDPVFSS
jgi:hypothetical protein